MAVAAPGDAGGTDSASDRRRDAADDRERERERPRAACGNLSSGPCVHLTRMQGAGTAS